MHRYIYPCNTYVYIIFVTIILEQRWSYYCVTSWSQVHLVLGKYLRSQFGNQTKVHWLIGKRSVTLCLVCLTRCQLSLESFNNLSEFTVFLKTNTQSNIQCSMSVVDIKSYIDIKYDEYLERRLPNLLRSAHHLGLQPADGTVIFDNKVGNNCII